MALSDELLGFTSPILDRAVKTGGWGVTIKKDDPSVVSDALFKKATLDLGIAQLQMNTGLHEMDSRMNVAMHALDNNITLQDMLNKERQNHVGFFEALVTDLAGAAEGAVTGFAVGGPVGAVVGGAAGFGVTAASQAESGRRGGQGAMSALGTIAGAATTIKGFSDQAKAKDSWTSILQTAGGIVGKMNSGSPSDRAAAHDEWGAMLNNAAQSQIDAGVNPEQAFTAVRKFGDSMLSGAVDGNTAMLNRYNDFAGIQNPTREDFKKFWGDQSMNFQAANKKEASDDFLVSQVEGAHPGLMNSLGYGNASANRQRPVIPEQGGPAADPTQHALPIERPRQAPRQASAPLEIEALDSNGNVIPNPTRGRAINQPAPSSTGSVQQRMASNFPQPQISRPGLQMAGPPPAAQEQQLAQQGANTVQTLNKTKDEQGRSVMDKLLHGGNVPVIGGVPGLLDSGGIHQDQQAELDAKGTSQGKQHVASDEIKNLSPEQSIGRDLPPGAAEGDMRELVHKKAQGIEKFVDKTLGPVEQAGGAKTAGPQSNMMNQRNAAADLRKLDETLDSLPQGKVKRFLADAAAEGKSAEAIETVAMLAGTGAATMGTKLLARGAVAAADVAPAAAQKAFDFATKAGLGDLMTRAGLGVGVFKGVEAGAKGVVAEGAKAFLTNEEKDAVTKLSHLNKNLRSELINSGIISAHDTKVDSEKEFEKLLPSVLDAPRTRYRKMLNVLNDLEDTAQSAAHALGAGSEGADEDGNPVPNVKHQLDELKLESAKLNIQSKRQSMARQQEKSLAAPARKKHWIDLTN